MIGLAAGLYLNSSEYLPSARPHATDLPIRVHHFRRRSSSSQLECSPAKEEDGEDESDAFPRRRWWTVELFQCGSGQRVFQAQFVCLVPLLFGDGISLVGRDALVIRHAAVGCSARNRSDSLRTLACLHREVAQRVVTDWGTRGKVEMETPDLRRESQNFELPNLSTTTTDHGSEEELQRRTRSR